MFKLHRQKENPWWVCASHKSTIFKIKTSYKYIAKMVRITPVCSHSASACNYITSAFEGRGTRLWKMKRMCQTVSADETSLITRLKSGTLLLLIIKASKKRYEISVLKKALLQISIWFSWFITCFHRLFALDDVLKSWTFQNANGAGR